MNGSGPFDYTTIVDATKGFVVNIAGSVPSFLGLVRAASWVVGFLLLIGAILKLRHHLTPGKEGIVPRALWQMFFATLLLYLDTSFQAATSTIFVGQEWSPISYTKPTVQGYVTPAEVAQAVLVFLEFVGWVSFFRGIMILNKFKTQIPPPPDVSVGKGVTHILGGVLLANMGLFATYLVP